MNPNQEAGGILVIDTEEKALRLLRELEDYSGYVGLDTETVGVDPTEQSPVLNGQVVCWSLAYGKVGIHSVWKTPLVKRVFLWSRYLHTFKAWLENPEKKKVGHNIFSFDRQMLLNHGINLQGIAGDTLRMSKLLKNDKRINHGLKSLMYLKLGYKLADYKELFYRPKQLASKFYEKEKRTRRKVDGSFVPTLICEGEVCRFSDAFEPIPLDTIEQDYPWLVPTLIDYASLDAKATLELYYMLREKYQETPWQIFSTSMTASGTPRYTS